MLFRLRRVVLAAAPAVALLTAGVGAVPATAATAPVGSGTPAPTASGTPTTTATLKATAIPTPTPAPLRTTAPAPVLTAPAPKPTVSAPVPSPSPTLTPTPRPTPVPVVPYPTAVALDHTAGRTANTRTVWLTGTGLGNVSQVLVGGVPADRLTLVSPTRLGVLIGTAPGFQAATASISLVAASDGAVLPTRLTFQWVVQNRVDRQMRYAFSHWNDYASAQFGYLPGNDCANFTSQTLKARGWRTGSAWFNHGQGDWAATWVSSTAMSKWLAKRTDLATHLLYRQRDDVRVGDIVQFNYEGVGTWWDHTAVVSKVVVLPNGRHDIYYVAHTNNTRYGGSTEYLAHHRSALRIQFWRLKV